MPSRGYVPQTSLFLPVKDLFGPWSNLLSTDMTPGISDRYGNEMSISLSDVLDGLKGLEGSEQAPSPLDLVSEDRGLGHGKGNVVQY